MSAVIWSGWRLLKQEGIVQAQRSRDRLEQSADRIAAVVRGALAETEKNSARRGTVILSTDELALAIKDDGVRLTAGGPLLYEPAPPPEPEASPNLFADAELLEFAQNRPSAALEEYRRLGASTNAAIRAGALVREARVLRSLGREQESHAARAKSFRSTKSRTRSVPQAILRRISSASPTLLLPEPLPKLTARTICPRLAAQSSQGIESYGRKRGGPQHG